MRSITHLGVVAIVIAAAASASATTVRRASVAELANASDVVVHGVVQYVDDRSGTSRQGPFLTAVEIELLEVIKGLDPKTETLRLVLPGGRAYDRTALVPGMPRLTPGDEVVLLLEKTTLSFIFTGLGQGVFRVRRGGEVPVVSRSFGGMHLVGPPTHDLGFEPTLDGLLSFLRASADEGGAQ